MCIGPVGITKNYRIQVAFVKIQHYVPQPSIQHRLQQGANMINRQVKKLDDSINYLSTRMKNMMYIAYHLPVAVVSLIMIVILSCKCVIKIKRKRKMKVKWNDSFCARMNKIEKSGII